MEEIVIIGAGGHSKVIIDIIEKRKILLNQKIKILGILDDNYKEKKFLGYDYLGKIEDYKKLKNYKTQKFILAIGSNEIRFKLVNQLDLNYITLIHPSVILGSEINIGAGTVIMAGAIINSFTSIGNHTIINTGAIVEHDCKIKDYVHISPRAVLAGGVSIEEKTWIGAGSTIIQGIKIGKEVLVGAGSVVVKDISNFKKVLGVPAKER